MSVSFQRHHDRVWLRYMVDCPEELIALGGLKAAERTDQLWRSTCLEAFVRHGEATCYAEYNFAPDSRWAAYAFDRYREGMQPLPIPSPEIWLEGGASWFAIEVEVAGPDISTDETHLALSAVIEETDGTKSYWALRHPPGKPDFHHPDCFALTLEAPGPV